MNKKIGYYSGNEMMYDIIMENKSNNIIYENVLDDKKKEIESEYCSKNIRYEKIKSEYNLLNNKYHEIKENDQLEFEKRIKEIKNIKKLIKDLEENNNKLIYKMNNNAIDNEETKIILIMININESKHDDLNNELHYLDLIISDNVINFSILELEKQKLDNRFKIESDYFDECKKKYREFNDRYFRIKDSYDDIFKNL